MSDDNGKKFTTPPTRPTRLKKGALPLKPVPNDNVVEIIRPKSETSENIIPIKPPVEPEMIKILEDEKTIIENSEKISSTHISKRSIVPLLHVLKKTHGSDLHIKAYNRPRIRIHGELKTLDLPPLTPQETEDMAMEVLPETWKIKFLETNEADFSYAREDLGRFRTNVFRQMGSVGLVFRTIITGAPDLQDLHVPELLKSLALEPRGLVLITGPTGSGKTTTMAGMVNEINKYKNVNIVTVEDPIEIVHQDNLAMINQREVGSDTQDFRSALRAAMRQDPDVLLIGEMRDVETVKTAINAAETGHFVMSSLHTMNVQETISRIIDFFPSHERQQVRLALAGILKGVICQRLVSKADGSGRIVAMEVAVNTGRIAEAIEDEKRTNTITQIISESGYDGMQTFDQHLLIMLENNEIKLDDALRSSTSPHNLKATLKRLGRLPL